MHRYLLGQLRNRGTRTFALLLGILVATTSFTVLTGTARTSQLQTVGTVRANFRSAYDILVRPKGSTTGLERSRGLVRADYLSGIYGGITMDQYRQVKAVPGVEVAAPVAMIGYALPRIYVPIDATRFETGRGREAFRVAVSWRTDRDLSHIPGDPYYVYVTPNYIKPPTVGGQQMKEVGRSGETRSICPNNVAPPSPYTEPEPFSCWSRDPADAEGLSLPGFRPGHHGALLTWPFPFLIAAVDPVQEARLAGLNRAMVSGRYLSPRDVAQTASPDFPGGQIPVLVSSVPQVDLSAQLVIERLAPSGVATIAAGATAHQLRSAAGAPLSRATLTTSQVYRLLLARMALRHLGPGQVPVTVDAYWTGSPTSYAQLGAARLRPEVVRNPLSVWKSIYYYNGYARLPAGTGDVQFRRLQGHPAETSEAHQDPFPALTTVGTFDPARLPGVSPLSQVPLETYRSPAASGADARTRGLLAGRSLLPSGSLPGYLQQPPLMITTLVGMAPLLDTRFPDAHYTDPISTIRVRVAGVSGPDPVSRERVRAVAQQITQRTGLDVDITIGSSPTPMTIDLPAGRYGRPELSLRQGWVKKGVAVAILSAVDRKSLVLFGLILAVCALFVANAAAASVRSRRTELGVLACLGWHTRKLFAAVLLEVGLVGLAAGVLGSLVALPLGAAFGLTVSVPRAALAVPAAVVLALLAGLVPAWRAAHSDPGAAVRPAVLTVRRAHTPRGILGLAATNLARVPGRSLLGALSLAVGVCALTLLLAVTLAFRGQLVGSLLGDAIAVQIRGVDYVAAAVTVLLGALAVADVLYLNIRERSAEFATLRAVGWPEGKLARLVTFEGLGMGLLGSVSGAAVGLAAAVVFAGRVPPALFATAATSAAVGTLIAAAAAAIPAALLRRLPTARTLAEE
jgi:ABC-type lipoprotein release transport system permease subunit